jgi:hypothetical protein
VAGSGFPNCQLRIALSSMIQNQHWEVSVGKGKRREGPADGASLIPADSTEYIAVSRGVRYGHSIRQIQTIGSTYQQPRDIHLIYIGMNGTEIIARHMRRFNIDARDIDRIEEELVREAEKATPPRVGQYAQDFQRLEFQRATYLTMVIGVPDWEFYYPFSDEEDPVPGELHDPLVFIEKKQQTQAPAAQNYAFYNCVKVTPGGYNGFRCINFFTADATGSPIRTVLDYRFEIYIRIPFSPVYTPLAPIDLPLMVRDVSGRLTSGRTLTIIIDPDGQNQGP